MVIAADGRERINLDVVNTDRMQKIYPISGHPVAYTIFGSTLMRTGEEKPCSIDLIEEAKKAAGRVSLNDCDNIFTYVERFAHPIQERLASWRTGPDVLFPSLEENDPPRSTIAHFYFFGYHQGSTYSIDLRFFHVFHALQEHSISVLDSPIGFPPLVMGSKRMYESLFNSSDERLSGYRESFPVDLRHFSLNTAAAVARDYIRACSDGIGQEIDPVGCAGIGGRIHIAKITPSEGFQWIIPPAT